LQAQGQHSQAVNCFRRAVSIRPDFGSAHSNLGIALRDLGQSGQALVHFRRAVELEPPSASAQTNLGQMLLDLGDAVDALAPCQEAVRLQPNVAALQFNLGNAHRDLGQGLEAKTAYLEALRLDPNLAAAQAQLGLILQQEGRLAEALPWLKQATELQPNDAGSWENLAELYGEREESNLALPCWERVVDLAPEKTGAHVSLGWALQEAGRANEAESHFRTAVRLQPEYAAAHLNLGGLFEEQGKMAEAESAFREALKAQPLYALPHARLATMLRGKLPESDQAALEERLLDKELAPGFRARLLFGLAHALDARGEYARAADCIRQANALALEIAQGHREYAAADHEQFMDGLEREFSPEFFERTTGGGNGSGRPVFIFGLPRSGTTLVEQVLASHPHIHGAGELRLARESFETLPAFLGRNDTPLACVAQLGPNPIRRLAARHLEALAKLDGGKAELIVDKMPDNYMYLGYLAAQFPNAVFIHCRRDLRDVAVSCWMTDFRSIRWANNTDHIAARFLRYRQIMDHWKAVLPVPIHEVDYEESVTDLEGVARRLLEACRQEWDPRCLEFHRTERSVRTASVAQVRQPVYRRSLGRWKHYETELADLFEALTAQEEVATTGDFAQC
jgi:tetratricopeptide (TPR) repeat protein